MKPTRRPMLYMYRWVSLQHTRFKGYVSYESSCVYKHLLG